MENETFCKNSQCSVSGNLTCQPPLYFVPPKNPHLIFMTLSTFGESLVLRLYSYFHFHENSSLFFKTSTLCFIFLRQTALLRIVLLHNQLSQIQIDLSNRPAGGSTSMQQRKIVVRFKSDAYKMNQEIYDHLRIYSIETYNFFFGFFNWSPALHLHFKLIWPEIEYPQLSFNTHYRVKRQLEGGFFAGQPTALLLFTSYLLQSLTQTT